jgi:hypothetical protein
MGSQMDEEYRMKPPFRTTEKDQAERCIKACEAKTAITEVFDAGTVTGQVQSVVDNKDAAPRSWSITFVQAT